ncbi:Wzz/FepE/Etk N-terminal domain-containing protein [Cupriavidus pinatubonensis]|uniref:Wzz/FepE/Etk N-terminal domain-containing protein n=1 Tax=Cupriavidus pinatubonensis TaxID=248026 RepID=UPI00361AE6B3
MSFEDGLNFLRRHFGKIICAGVVGAGIGLGLTFVIPKQWEATAILQVGQIASENATPTQIETTARAVERLKLEQFEDRVIVALGLPLEAGESRSADLIRNSSKILLLRNADLIQISTRGNSPDEAKRFAQAYCEELINAHAALAKPSLDKLKADLADVQSSLATEESRRTQLSTLLNASNRAGVVGKFSENVLLNDIVSDNDKQLRQLRLHKNSVEEKLSPERTFNTRILGVVDVTRRAVYPKKVIFAIAGLMVGLFLALVIGLWRDRQASLREEVA